MLPLQKRRLEDGGQLQNLLVHSLHSRQTRERGMEKKEDSLCFALKRDTGILPKTCFCRDQNFSQSRDKTIAVSKEVGCACTAELLFHQSLFMKSHCSHVTLWTLRYHWEYCHDLHRALEHIQNDLLEITQQVCKRANSAIQAPDCPFSHR